MSQIKIAVTFSMQASFSGDKLVIASTDYAWEQAEEVEVALCPPGDCNSQEVRVDGQFLETYLPDNTMMLA